MNREIYVCDNEWIIAPIAEIDRTAYVELHRQINGDGTLFLNPVCKDWMWKQVFESKDIKTFSVLNKEMSYCGSIEVQNCNSKTPELGIDLLESKRNKGICPQVIPMIAKKYFKENSVDYYLIRISSNNPHSIHVFEKMGAIRIQEGISSSDSVMVAIKRVIGNDEFESMEEQLKRKLGYQENEVIYEYKLMPKSFL